MTKLDEVPTSELVAELENRSVVSIISLMCPEGPEVTTRSWTRGNRFTLLGMLTVMCDGMVCKLHEESDVDDGTD